MSPFRKNRGQRVRFRPAVEGLEDRTVPAGNVIAAVNGGSLFIIGDADSNFITVKGNTRGTVDIASIDASTTINNQPGLVTFTGFSGSVIVKMGDGNDAVVMDRIDVRGTLDIDMGNGDDSLALSIITMRNDAVVAMGNGNDILMFGSTTVGNNAYVNAGPGDNQVHLYGARFNRASFFVAGFGTSSLGNLDSKFKKAPSVVGFQQKANSVLPTAFNDSSTVAANGTVSINVASNDRANAGALNTSSIVITQQPAHGTATANGDGTVSYKNDGSSAGADSFKYTIANGSGAVSNNALVTISVTGVAGPSVNVTSSAGAATKTTPIPFTATFSDDVTGFAQSDLTVTNGTASNFVATNGRTYTFDVTPTGQGAVVVTVPASVAQNSAGQGNTASSATTVTFDTTPPVVTVNPLTTNSTTPTITGTVNEANSTVTVTVNNQTVNATVTGTTWSATITTALTAGTFAVTATATDPAGNTATANNGSALVIDLTPPTYLITSSLTSPTGSTSIPITVTFSEDVTGFIASDIAVTNGTLSNFTTVDAKTYTATITPTASGAVTANIGAGAATDKAGNANAAAAGFTITFDSGIPGVSITSSATSPTNLTSIPITIVFTENVTGFVDSDITVTNGTISNFTAIDGKTYTAALTPTNNGLVTVNVAAGVANDVDNNGNSSGSFSITFDTTIPTATITTTTTSPTNSTSIPITVTFSEDVTGFIAGDIVVTNGTLGAFTAVDGKTYTATITPTASGVVAINIAAGAATDAAGNPSASATNSSITFDNTSPIVAITSTETSPTGSTSIPITVTFSEDVTGFAATDLVVTNGTLSNFTAVNGTTYTATITPTANGAVTANIAAAAATDAAGNANTASAQFAITFNNSIPGVAITSSATSPTNSTSIPITVTFTENVTGFDASDITVGNGTLSNFTSVDAKTFTATLTPTANGAVTANIAAGAAFDIDNNGNSAASFSITFDSTGPTASITSSATSPTGLTNIPITVTFSEVVSGFDAGDIAVINGTLINFAAVNGTTYTAMITPASNGAVTANIAAGAVTDTAGNASSAAPEFSITFDNTSPTVFITSTETSPTGSTSIPITVTFSENVTDFAAADIAVTNGTLSNFTAVNGTTYTATITPTADGPITANIAAAAAIDAAGNASTAATEFSIAFNSGIPGVAITSSATSPTKLTSIPITVTFTENVTGFVANDITVSNGTLSNFAAVDGKTYTATITPTADGAVTANIAAGVAVDVDNNGNSATSFSITFDSTSPTVAITSSETSPTGSTAIPVTITFSETVSSFIASDVVVTNGTLNNFVSVDGKVYTATITPTATGVVKVNVAAGVATDAAGNDNVAAPEFSITFADNVSPTVAITSSLTSPTGTSPIPITVTFSENVTGFEATDITVGNGTLGNFTAVDGKTYTAAITPTAAGPVTVNIAAGVATDTAGNANTAAPAFSITFNNSAPTVAHTIANISKTAAADNTTILLPGTFADADITDSSVTFKVMKGTTPVDLNVELLDKDAPLTVANFFNYISRYEADAGTIFHRLHLENGLKVIQGGGYTFDDATDTISNHITTDAPIRNEFSPDRLDVRGTLAMAKLGGDPDSATSEFFFNLDDANGNTLNGNNNGGFVVFGKLAGAADLANIDSLASVPIKGSGAFPELPLVDGTTIDENNIERIQQIVVNHRDGELTYTATSSNPAIVTAAVGGFQGNQLTLDYLAAGTSTITVTATDKAGQSASTTFVVTVT